jgi:hypothetical protein
LEFERFLSSVFDELATKYPALHDNVVIRELIREASRGNEQWEP